MAAAMKGGQNCNESLADGSVSRQYREAVRTNGIGTDHHDLGAHGEH